MSVQRETGSHRAVKVIKRSHFDTSSLQSSSGPSDDSKVMTEEEREAELERRRKTEIDLRNEVKILCKLVIYHPILNL